MPVVFGKESKKKELIRDLDKIYTKIQREHSISPGDFPSIDKMRECLVQYDFKTFKPLDMKLIEKAESMLSADITQLMQLLPKEDHGKKLDVPIRGGAFTDQTNSPFGIGQTEGLNAGMDEIDWIVEKDRAAADASFLTLNLVAGKIPGSAAKAELVKSKLPNQVLARVWNLSDCDKDGMLDVDEWALANYLIKLKLDGFELPTSLPVHLIPPSKRTGGGGGEGTSGEN
jgi:EH domain-containing protein 1